MLSVGHHSERASERFPLSLMPLITDDSQSLLSKRRQNTLAHLFGCFIFWQSSIGWGWKEAQINK